MEVKASLNNLRTAPRKVRQVADLVREKKVDEAQEILEVTVKKSSGPVLKLLRSAIASAVHNFKLKESNLYISKITVDEGPKFKRSRAMSRGRAYPILKRTSHITLVLREIHPVTSTSQSGRDARVIREAETPVLGVSRKEQFNKINPVQDRRTSKAKSQKEIK